MNCIFVFFQKQRSQFDELMHQVKNLSQETRSKYEILGQSIPTESGHQVCEHIYESHLMFHNVITIDMLHIWEL